MKKLVFILLVVTAVCATANSQTVEKFTPTDDTFIYWSKKETSPRGNYKVLEMRYTPIGEYRRDTYIKFDISKKKQHGPYKKAVLKLYGSDAGIPNVPLRVIKIESTYENYDWNEKTMTFVNRPVATWNTDNIADIITIGDKKEKYFEWDITNWVNHEIESGRNIINLQVRQLSIPGTDNAPIDIMRFHSKENPSGKKPLLELIAED